MALAGEGDYPDIRLEFRGIRLMLHTYAASPFDQFEVWMKEAEKAELSDPNAMIVATSTLDGRPSLRTVLLKGVDPRGFVFYTNKASRKGDELAANPQTSLLFFWKSLHRQVRIEGRVEDVTDAEADAYYATRARVSRLGAWASNQSRALSDRSVLEERLAEMEAKYPDENIPRPPYWSGYRVLPGAIRILAGYAVQAARSHDLHPGPKRRLGPEQAVPMKILSGERHRRAIVLAPSTQTCIAHDAKLSGGAVPMAIRKILLPLTGTAAGEAALATALTIARRWNAHVLALHVRVDSRDVAPLAGEGLSGAMIEEMMSATEKESSDRAQAVRAMFDRFVARHDVMIQDAHPSSQHASASFAAVTGREEDIVAQQARLADLTVVPHPGCGRGCVVLRRASCRAVRLGPAGADFAAEGAGADWHARVPRLERDGGVGFFGGGGDAVDAAGGSCGNPVG